MDPASIIIVLIIAVVGFGISTVVLKMVLDLAGENEIGFVHSLVIVIISAMVGGTVQFLLLGLSVPAHSPKQSPNAFFHWFRFLS